MSRLKVRRLGYAMGAEVSGIDAARPLDDETIDEIRRAWLEHIVLCFPKQRLSGDEMQRFCGQFGELSDLHASPNRHPGTSGLMVIASKPVSIDGTTIGGYGRANFWHSDYSFTDRPTTLTFLLCKSVPNAGGDTMFANQYLAYDALSEGFKHLIAPLSGIHDIKEGSGYASGTAEQRERMRTQNPPAIHPIVRSHPETGRPSLYVGDRVRDVVGMTAEESKPLLDFLRQQAVRCEFTYRHRWAVDDLVLWDNGPSMHFAVQDYDETEFRQMLRCSLRGPKSGSLLKETNDALTFS